MKRIIAAAFVAAFLCMSAGAATWTAYKGAILIRPVVIYNSQDDCEKAIRASQVQGIYGCVTPAVRVPVTVGPPDMTNGVYVNPAKIPAPGVGSAVDLIDPAVQMPNASGDGTGDFRTVCQFSHMGFDDPIVYPGQPGKSHLHVFFGNSLTNANSTAASIAGAGNSSCRGGTINRSAYWVPAVIDTKDGTPIKPALLHAYYKSGYHQVPAASIQPLPVGLRMVAGDPKASSPVEWGPVQFTCQPGGAGPGSPWSTEIPLTCPVGSAVWTVVRFPQCWDGVNLDSPDHRSHMAYGNSDGGHPPLGCPATHPIALPEITLHAGYTVTDTAALKRWRLASDTYDRALPAGYSMHGDYMNGWKPDVAVTWAAKCVQAAKDCGSSMLGDGRLMGEAKP